jgi:hypothetical protein
MLQVLPGVSVVPHQRDGTEQHGCYAKDNPTVHRCLHAEKITDYLGRKQRIRGTDTIGSN